MTDKLKPYPTPRRRVFYVDITEELDRRERRYLDDYRPKALPATALPATTSTDSLTPAVVDVRVNRRGAMSMTTMEKLRWMQERAHHLVLETNPHKSAYRTIEDELALQIIDHDEFESPEVRSECISRGQLVVLRCYPRTNIGRYQVAHHDIERAVDIMFSIVEPELRDRP